MSTLILEELGEIVEEILLEAEQAGNWKDDKILHTEFFFNRMKNPDGTWIILAPKVMQKGTILFDDANKAIAAFFAKNPKPNLLALKNEIIDFINKVSPVKDTAKEPERFDNCVLEYIAYCIFHFIKNNYLKNEVKKTFKLRDYIDVIRRAFDDSLSNNRSTAMNLGKGTIHPYADASLNERRASRNTRWSKMERKNKIN